MRLGAAVSVIFLPAIFLLSLAWRSLRRLLQPRLKRPWPEEEIREATKNSKHIFVPEFNVTGWLAKEIRATIPNPQRVHAGPHVCGGMTMPPEIIVSEIKTALGMKSMSLAGRGS